MVRTVAPAALVVALTLGATTGIAVSKNGEDDPPGTTTSGTTTDGTTGTTTGNTTGTTTTGASPTTPTTPRAPRIVEAEVDGLAGGRLRLRAEVRRRGAAVSRVRFTYRGRTFIARRRAGTSVWTRTVTARDGDGADDAVVSFRVRACAGTRCASRTFRDDA